MSKPNYGAALDELEQMHQRGLISDSRYELHKAKLLAEATRVPLPVGVRILIFVGLLMVFGIVMQAIAAVING